MSAHQKGVISPTLILAIVAILAVAGYFVFEKNLATKPTTNDTPNASSQSQLKTYTDTERGVSVSYPKDWIVEQIKGSKPRDPKNPEEKTLEFRPAGERYVPLFQITKIEKSDSWNPEEYKKELAKPGGELSQSESTVTINGISGWNLSAVINNNNSVEYFQFSANLLSEDNQTFYEINTWDARDNPNKEILDQMLNSFKIIKNTISSAKGVIILKTPAKGEEIKSPLTVSGLVYGNNGTLTIKLKQKESNQYVTEDKIVKILGQSDNISFAESLQFGLPAMPQIGILEVEYKDSSGKGLDDKVSLEVNFPSDLGSGR